MTTETSTQILISVSSDEELAQIQQSLLDLLSMVEVERCGPVRKESVKALYKLLNCIMEAKSSGTKHSKKNFMTMSTPLLKFPTATELSLYLLKEELKMNRFFADLHELGLENHSPYQLELSPVIFASMGLEGTDETFERYVVLLNKHSENLGTDNTSMLNAALALYADLLPNKATDIPK